MSVINYGAQIQVFIIVQEITGAPDGVNNNHFAVRSQEPADFDLFGYVPVSNYRVL